ETLAKVPADQEKKFKALGQHQFFAAYARDRCKELRLDGVYIVICKEPGHLQVHPAGAARGAALSGRECDTVRDALIEEFREQEFNLGLLAGLAALEKALKGKAR